ncbi:MAG: hypothetical protein COA99_16890 [Moraxellaceae bacterium]|nr:MAG: hypothetical protein COA99_16890 [Moraxellaceae bacterium]
MAKKKIDTSKLNLSLGKKRPIKKTTTRTKKVDSDEVVKKIHPEVGSKTRVSTPVKPRMETPSEPTKRVTLDIPVSLHKRIKMNVFDMETTMKKYFLELAEKDLKSKDK